MTSASHTPGRELLPTATPARTRAAVRELLRPHRALAAGGAAVMVAATAVGLLTQPLLGHIIDLVTDRSPAGALTVPVVLLVVVAVAQGVATALGMSLVSRLGETVLAELRERFVERALSLPLDRLERAYPATSTPASRAMCHGSPTPSARRCPNWSAQDWRSC